MRFLAFLEEATGVRGFVVSNAAGEHLADMGTGAKLSWTAAHVAAIAQELAVAGTIAGLGNLQSAAVKGSQSSRLLALGSDGVALLDLEPARATADLEALLRSTEWLSDPVSVKPMVRGDASQCDTVPPLAPIPLRPVPPAQSVPAASTQSVGPHAAPVAHLAVPPARSPEPPRPQAGPSIAAGSVPRAASPKGSLLSRSPPLPPRPLRSQTAAAAPMPLAAAVQALASETAKPSARQSSEVRIMQREDPAARPSAPLLTGSLGTFALPDLLEFLRVGKRSGTLVCTGSAGLGAIHMSGGRITGVASPRVPSIGDWLVERGAISREQLHEALRHQVASGATVPLGTTLVAEKFVSREALQEALRLHVASVVRTLMTWENGDFTFDPVVDSEASALALGVEVDPQAVLLDIFKDIDHSQRA